jgi:hypothetical protein
VAARGVRDAGRAQGPGRWRTGELATPDADRGLRWIVFAYVRALIGGGLVALVGLAEGWW